METDRAIFLVLAGLAVVLCLVAGLAGDSAPDSAPSEPAARGRHDARRAVDYLRTRSADDVKAYLRAFDAEFSKWRR